MLAFEVSGKPDGFPVFLLHGTPGSKSGPKPRPIYLYRSGVRLICYDRPGYGESARLPGRSVASAAYDVEAIANKLGLDRFAVVGRSGGGPHALACASILESRITKTSVLVSIAPASAPDLDWYGGMTAANVEEYNAADSDLDDLIERLTTRTNDVRVNPETMLDFLRSQMSECDLPIVEDIAIRRLLHTTYREALQDGPEGWIDDVLAFRKSWGFGLNSFTTPVLLWHGQDDTFSPVSHTYWLQKQLLNAQVRVQPRASHFGAVPVLPEVLDWLTDPGEKGHGTDSMTVSIADSTADSTADSIADSTDSVTDSMTDAVSRTPTVTNGAWRPHVAEHRLG
ncbi:MAG TPA: alpha/beta fold hydrolase [Candidatus Limnocylindrales bacterium]|nr:alpha/beta fold hydrolase [Candidatus Limnocylindrales bacterium]